MRDGGQGDSDVVRGDADADADAGTDSDATLNPLPEPVEWQGRCHDGVDDSELVEGLDDCEEAACVGASTTCCQQTARPWVSGDFSVCDDVEACGWVAFAGSAAVERPWVILAGAGDGDVGIATAGPVAELHGEPLLTFAASLEPACAGASCLQLLGVALTGQESLGSGAAVRPALGLVLDGEQEAIHLVVAGRVEATFDAPIEELTGLRGYALRLLEDGVVELHRGLPVDESAEAPVVEVAGVADRVPTQGRLGSASGLRVVVFGRLGDGTGRVGAVGLQRPVCDDPAGFTRAPPPSGTTAAGMVIGLGPSPDQAVGGPAVAADPWDQATLLMVFEEGVALTGDPNARWRLEVGKPSVAMRADGSLVMAFVGTNTCTGETALGLARSTDGKTWSVDQEPLDLDPPLPFERDGVSGPHVAVWGSVIHLWYAGTNGSELAIGHAFWPDGADERWTRYGKVLGAGEPWEARRLSAPAVVLRPVAGEADVAELFLWYQAGAQGRERIGLVTRELPAQEIELPSVAW